MRARILGSVAGVLAMTMVSGAAVAQSAADKEAAKNAIWAKEQAIYQGRASGALKFYVDNASPNYLGWPPGPAKPVALPGLRQDSQRMEGLNKEKLAMNFVDFTLHGDTGIIYYMNHRTSMPDGRAVDEKWETIHVWVRDNGDWKIVGAMARQEPKRGGN